MNTRETIKVDEVTPEILERVVRDLRTVGGIYELVAAWVEYDNTPPEPIDGCGHDVDLRTDYTGTLCSACYRDIEMRIAGFAGYCSTLRSMAAPSTVSAARYGERVQETKGEQRLIIDERLIALADTLYRAGVRVILETADRLHVDRPHALLGCVNPPAYVNGISQMFLAQSVEAWIDRNLWLIVSLEDAAALLEPLVDALIEARRATNPTPPRRATRRTKCSECLGSRVTIEARERGIFFSSCGDCGKAGPIHARIVEAVLRGDSDRGSESDRATPTDDLALSSGRRPPGDEARP